MATIALEFFGTYTTFSPSFTNFFDPGNPAYTSIFSNVDGEFTNGIAGLWEVNDTIFVSGGDPTTFSGVISQGSVEIFALFDGFNLYSIYARPQDLPDDPPLPFTMPSYADFQALLASSPDEVMVCFAAGTLIATPGGEVPVERLRPGDAVLAADGRSVAVRWIGRQTVHRLFTPEERFRPVLIRAGALDEAIPHADLVVTADHALAIDGILANAGALVNGTSIVRLSTFELPESVTYFHVETGGHDLVLANGAPAETFVDNATRRLFDNHAEYEALFGAGPHDTGELPLPRALSRRQLPRDLRDRLAVRAVALGRGRPDALAAA